MFDYFNRNVFEFMEMCSFIHDVYGEDKQEENDEYDFVDDYGDYVLLRNKKTGEEVLERKEE